MKSSSISKGFPARAVARRLFGSYLPGRISAGTVNIPREDDEVERHVIAVHTAFAALSVLVLGLSLEIPTGWLVAFLVFLYNAAIPATALAFGHRLWIRIWCFLVPLSALQVVPDWFLSAELGVLVFPDIGFPKIGTVSAFMAGMWTIPLFVALYLGERVRERRSPRAAVVTVAAASFVLFVGSEAVLWRLSIWHAQGVMQVAHVALYVVVPEVLLGIAAYLAFRATEERSWWLRLVAAFAVMTFYLGALVLFFFLVERLL